MRNGNDNGILLSDSKQVIAVNLGADYCAEHEWGIKGIEHKFGLQDTKVGLGKRQITQVPSKGLHWVEIKVPAKKSLKEKAYVAQGFYFDQGFYGEVHSQKRAENRLYLNEKYGRTLDTAWDEGSFCAFAADPEKIKQLREIFDAFSRKDIAIWLGGGGVFQNAGLVIGIASRLAPEVLKNWKEADEAAIEVQRLFKETGIEDLLKKAGKRYFALSPRKDTKEPCGLIFWLNPMEQDKYESHWFTLDDLKQWAEDKGPVLKKNRSTYSERKVGEMTVGSKGRK